MKKTVVLSLVMGSIIAFSGAGLTKEGGKEAAGEKLFKKHCSKCHPDGGNVVNLSKTLNPKDRAANKVKTEEDIINMMRKPGPGMVKFGTKTISEKDAKAIAEYIMKTFSK